MPKKRSAIKLVELTLRVRAPAKMKIEDFVGRLFAAGLVVTDMRLGLPPEIASRVEKLGASKARSRRK